MATLYNLTENMMKLYEMMSEDDLDRDTEDMILDTAEAVDGEIEAKAEGYAMVIAELEKDSAALKVEIDRLMNRKRTIENNTARLKSGLQKAMEVTGKTKFKTQLFSFGIQNNPPSVVIDDESKIPAELLIPQPAKVDKATIKDLLKNGEILEYAHLEQGKSLRIR